MDTYRNPLVERYASAEMSYNFSPQNKFTTWRKLWLALAEVERDLGLPIRESQLKALRDNLEPIDWARVQAYEREFRHDVMAHIHAFGDAAPAAKSIIHLGATSAFVGDNTDLIQIRDGLLILKRKLVNVIAVLARFADRWKDLPTLGFTHYQPAQLTTVGKRATLWIQSLLLDWEELEFLRASLRFRGVKGATGTAASFKTLFDGDFAKVQQLDQSLAQRFGFEGTWAVSGQTYDRKLDAKVLHLLSNLAQSAHKFSNDVRLLQNLKEAEEPFHTDQIGSSAMAYKRNPMRSERMAALSKFVISMSGSTAMVAATQWFERSLDDSANKRLSLPQAMLATDAILEIWHNVVAGLAVYPELIARHIRAELPFMATEHILMAGVKKGGDRQELHEIIRAHSMEAAQQLKQHGKPNDLIARLSADKRIKMDEEALMEILDPQNFIGFAPAQTTQFLHERVKPILEQHSDLLGLRVQLKV